MLKKNQNKREACKLLCYNIIQFKMSRPKQSKNAVCAIYYGDSRMVYSCPPIGEAQLVLTDMIIEYWDIDNICLN